MRSTVLILVVSLIVLATAQHSNDGPLFISKYLPDRPEVARKLSRVTDLPGWSGESYSGFITVNQTKGANHFFWFFPNPDKTAPVLLWLQGGPGASSMFGLFNENGPFSVSADGKLVARQFAWTNNFSIIWIDNPVGVGFSFVTDPNGFVTDQVQVGENLYSALTQFFQVFPDQQGNDFYVTGESYAGKYVPAISYKIDQANKHSPQIKINLKGLAIGDGIIDPLTMFTRFSGLMYHLGLADEEQAQTILKYEAKFAQAINQQRWRDAFLVFDEMLNGDFWPYGTYYANITGLGGAYFNFLDPVYPPNPYQDFLNNQARAALHVGDYMFADFNATVESHLIEDWPKSVAPWMPTLMDGYKVLIYNGHLDVILGPAAMEGWINTCPWSGQRQWRSVPRTVWHVPNHGSASNVGGWVRQLKQFTQVVVSNAGHLLPLDQPAAALDMITRWVRNQPFN